MTRLAALFALLLALLSRVEAGARGLPIAGFGGGFVGARFAEHRVLAASRACEKLLGFPASPGGAQSLTT